MYVWYHFMVKAVNGTISQIDIGATTEARARSLAMDVCGGSFTILDVKKGNPVE